MQQPLDDRAEVQPRQQERGRSRRRLEDERFLTGQGRYVDDIDEPGQLYGHLLRSPLAHGRIVSLDLSDASAMPGVVAIFTAADLLADGIGDLPCDVDIATEEPLVIPPRPALAVDRVRHVGDPIAFVVATSPTAAQDGAEAIAVAFDDLSAVVGAAAALCAGAPCVWDQAPGNLAFRFRKGDRAAVDAAMTAASTIVELTLDNNRVVVAALEPRAAIGTYDPTEDILTLTLTGQGVHEMRRQLADSVFRRPEARIHLVAPDVGGGFGAKNVLYPEWVLVLFAARRLRRPVKWTSTRSEDFLSSAQARDNRTRGRLALDRAGRFLALEVETLADMGAYLSALGPLVPTQAAASAMGGVYAIPAMCMEVRGAFTNSVPVDAYRGAGKPEANYLIERLAEVAAARIGMPPMDLRRLNIMSDFPYRSALGMTVERGAFAAHLDKALALSDQAGFAARRAEAARRGVMRGLGFGCYLETARGRPDEFAGVRFETDGTVSLLVGTQSNGQGHETSFPQIAADLLGLPIERFRLVQADTRRVPSGKGHGGARSLHQGGAALVAAIDGVLAKARTIAGQLLQSDPADLVFDRGAFSDPGQGRTIDLASVADAAMDPEPWRPGAAPGLACMVENPLDLVTFPNGCHAAEVEIDPETGVVSLERYIALDDFGTLVNPLLTAGQVQGGVAQGIGQASARAHRLRCLGPAPHGVLHGLRAATCGRPAGFRAAFRSRSERGQSAGGQGLGASRLHCGSADRDERHRGRLGAARH